MKTFFSQFGADIAASVTAISSAVIGAFIYKIYKAEKGEDFDGWAWLRHMIVAGAVGRFVYPYIPEGKAAGGLLALIGALSLQIMKFVDRDGLKILLKMFGLEKASQKKDTVKEDVKE